MNFRHMLGWIGRKKRQECADAISSLLIAKLTADTTATTITLPVASESHMKAFASRPLSPTASMQVNKLKDRINNRIWKESKGMATASVDYDVKNGRVSRLVVTATRLGTPSR